MPKLEDMPKVIGEGEVFPVDVPTQPPQGSRDGANRASDTSPHIGGGAIKLDPGGTQGLNEELPLNPLLPHGKRKVLDGRDVGREPRVTSAVLPFGNNEH